MAADSARHDLLTDIWMTPQNTARLARGFFQHLARRGVAGLPNGSAEALIPSDVAGVMWLHPRSVWAATTLGVDGVRDVAVEHPTVRKTWVDGGYRQHLVEHAATLGIDMHIVRRDPATRGFTVLPRRWTVERTLGWLMNHRRLARDYEAKPYRSEAMVYLAMINLMTRRLTAESTPSRRGT